MTECNRQRDMWEALRTEVMSRISDIDHATPWSEVEPEWWLEMMGVQRVLFSRTKWFTEKTREA